MTARGEPNRSMHGAPLAGGAQSGGELRFLFRASHIFASTVKEMLELELLREASPARLTASQYHLLKLACTNGGHPVGQMARFLGVSAPAATKNVDRLERLGLLVRRRPERDRRTLLLTASPEGRALVDRCEQLGDERLRVALHGLGPRRMAAFARSLERLAVSLLRSGGPGDQACLRCAASVVPDCPVSRVRGGCPYPALHARRWGQTAREETS